MLLLAGKIMLAPERPENVTQWHEKLITSFSPMPNAVHDIAELIHTVLRHQIYFIFHFLVFYVFKFEMNRIKIMLNVIRPSVENKLYYFSKCANTHFDFVRK